MRRSHLPTEIAQWAQDYSIADDAVKALYALLLEPMKGHKLPPGRGSETRNQTEVRLLASARENTPLWRNNVGAYTPPDGSGQVRYGLCNESKQVNARFKSSDLIGGTPVTVTRAMIGQRLLVFTAIEMKASSWKPGSDTAREKAQLRFINVVRAAGGIGFFCNNPAQYTELLNGYEVPYVTKVRPPRKKKNS